MSSDISFSNISSPMQCGVQLLHEFKTKKSPVAFKFNNVSKECELGHLGLAPGELDFIDKKADLTKNGVYYPVKCLPSGKTLLFKSLF